MGVGEPPDCQTDQHGLGRGCGHRAVTLELARKASDGTVYAVERKPEAVALLHENR